MRPLPVVLRVIGAGILLALAGVALGVSIAHSGYDPQQNRAPAARIVLAAMAFVCALVTLAFALPRAGAEHPRRRIVTGTGLAALSLFFLLAWLIIALSTGST